jgi:Zn-dependent protease
MDQPNFAANTPPSYPSAPRPSFAQKLKKALGPIGIVFVVLFKWIAKLKYIVLPAIKFLPVLLKTGGTMILSIGLYAMVWGFWFAAGFVILIFIHECGHLIAAKRLGLKVGAPVFIPFMGALIALKEAPKNAWIEAQVGIGGPLFGAFGSLVCHTIAAFTGKPIFAALAYSGYFLNLFNLAPIGFLDGGRIVTALSPWLWLVGLVVILGLIIVQPNILLIIILIVSLPRIFFLFRKKTDLEKRYYEVTPAQRWTIAILYFGLAAALFAGMQATYIPREALNR